MGSGNNGGMPGQTMGNQLNGSKDASSDWGFSRPLLKNPWFYFVMLCITVITISRPLLRSVPPPLPILKEIPNFDLVNQQGSPLGSAQLAGRPYVASFIFTRCQTACPLVSQKVAELRQQFYDGGLPIRLVSFSVDPEYDRPDRLLEFASQYQSDSSRGDWHFVTSPSGVGTEAYIQFIEDAFTVGVGEAVEVGETAMDIAHSEKLLLIDGAGRLRGYFDATADGINEIFHRSVHLLGEDD